MSTIEELEKYRRLLPVNKHRLDDELELQPDTMMRIATALTRANNRFAAAQNELDRTEAELWSEARSSRVDLKQSNDDIKSAIALHRRRQTAWEAVQGARTERDDWNALLEAWRERGFTLKTLAGLYAAEYFATDSIVVGERQRRRDQQQDERRAEMRRVSQSAATSREEPRNERRRRADV